MCIYAQYHDNAPFVLSTVPIKFDFTGIRIVFNTVRKQ